MSEEVLSLAFIEPVAGREAECEARLHEIGALVERKQYGRDAVYRDPQEPRALVLTRYWRSAETRRLAHEDPEMHRFWREMAELCRVTRVYEELIPV